jgi:hypothetical protein
MKKTLLKPISLLDIFIRFFSGFGAGVTGSIISLIILFLGWSIVGSAISPTDLPVNEFGISVAPEATHPLFTYFVILAVFLGILASSVSYVLISTLISEHYSFRTTLLTDVFFGNLILLVLMIPLYTVVNAKFGYMSIGISAGLHATLSALLSFFTLEIINWSKYLMVNLYGIILGFIIFSIVSILSFSDKTVFAFFILPFLFGFLSMGNALAQSIYEWFYKTYGNDFLNIETRFGDDYGK